MPIRLYCSPYVLCARSRETPAGLTAVVPQSPGKHSSSFTIAVPRCTPAIDTNPRRGAGEGGGEARMREARRRRKKINFSEFLSTWSRVRVASGSAGGRKNEGKRKGEREKRRIDGAEGRERNREGGGRLKSLRSFSFFLPSPSSLLT